MKPSLPTLRTVSYTHLDVYKRQSDGLAESIGKICGDYLYFHDAAAPIVTYESLDKDKVFFASRYGKGEADYINCPMNKEEYLLSLIHI